MTPSCMPGGNTTPASSRARWARRVDVLADEARCIRALSPKLWATSASRWLPLPFHARFFFPFVLLALIRSNQRSHRNVGCLTVANVEMFTAAKPGETWLYAPTSSPTHAGRPSASRTEERAISPAASPSFVVVVCPKKTVRAGSTAPSYWNHSFRIHSSSFSPCMSRGIRGS